MIGTFETAVHIYHPDYVSSRGHKNMKSHFAFLCLQMPLVTIAADNSVREKRLQDVHNFCSSQLVSCVSIF
jgi:hypothetical protein